jgi:hypothetical protein
LKVSELIEHLKTLDQDKEIEYMDTEYGSGCNIDMITLDDGVYVMV